MKFKNPVSVVAPVDGAHATNKDYVDGKQKTISWADYQSLSEAEKNNGTTYYIPDMPVSAGGEVVGSTKYCNAKLATDQTPGGNIPSNTLVLFESSSDDTIKVTNGLVTLEQGKTYNIICDLRATHDISQGDGIIEFALKDTDGNIYGNPGVNRVSLSSESESPCSVYSYTITPTQDITVGIYTCTIRFATSILASNSRLTITEIPSLQACINVTDDHIKEVANEEYIYKHYQGEEVLCAKLSDVSVPANWTRIPDLKIPEIDGYEIAHISPYVSSNYVCTTCGVSGNVIGGYGFSTAGGGQYVKYCAYVIYKKL